MNWLFIGDTKQGMTWRWSWWSEGEDKG